MDKPWQVIADLENHSSRINKEQIIEVQARAGNREFFEGARLAMDPMITFGIKQVPEKKDADGPGVDWDSFTLVLTGFVNRSFTGNLARDTINEMMKNSTRAQWNGWYRRILIKDLRCGVSEKTINKVVEKQYADFAVPVFGCQLAHDSANHEAKVTGRKFIEVKLDGVRVITIVHPDGRVDQFSRNGKELVNFEHIKQQFAAVAKNLPKSEGAWVFDGEVMSSSFQDLMKQVHRKSNVSAGDAVLHLFDCLPLSQFEQGGWKATQEFRSQHLKTWFREHSDKLPNVQILEQELVDLNTDTGQARFREINKCAVDGGYEGIMIKDPAAPYECKRTASWLKLKPFIEVTLEITDVEEGTGKNVGRLGAIVLRGVDDGRTIETNCGSGFSDDHRVTYWANRNRLPGQLVEVRADAITQNQDGSYSLRFPRFLRFRGFVAHEKI